MDEIEKRAGGQLRLAIAERLAKGRIDAAKSAQVGNAQEIERKREEQIAFLLRFLAHDELADLTADHRHHLQQFLIGLFEFLAEKLQNAEDGFFQQNRESQGAVE